jgi:hypothetical protein
LKPLHSAVGRIAKIAQLLEGFNIDPSKAELRTIAGELQNENAKAQKKVQIGLSSIDLHMAEKWFS